MTLVSSLHSQRETGDLLMAVELRFVPATVGLVGGKSPEYKHSLSGEFSEVLSPSATGTGDSLSSFPQESAFFLHMDLSFC